MNDGKKVVALVVGAGAVENAWAPVLRVLQPAFDFLLTGDGANSHFARTIYLLRWYSSSPNSQDWFRQMKEYLTELRIELCTELRAAQESGELRVRKEFKSIIDTLVIGFSTQFMLITTNWDTVVGDALARHMSKTHDGEIHPLHIHGSIDDPATLYLPTEVTKEPYRSHEEDQKIGGLHGSIYRGMERAERVVLYGLSLSPLDAELGQTLACGFSNNVIEEVCIVAPDHEMIAHRVNLLLDRRRQVTVKGYAPGDLLSFRDYTVKRETTEIPDMNPPK
jgi:hypothetical protein